MNRGRVASVTAGRVSVAGLAAWLVLFASVQVGLATPGREVLATSGAGAGLDYARVAATIAQLTEAFIAQALGLPDPTQDLGLADLRAAPPELEPEPVGATPGTGAAAAPGAGGPVTHPPDNDDFEQAYVVSDVPFAASTNAANATRQPGEPASCSPVGGTLWYRWTAAETRPAQADTAGSTGATTLAVFRGDELSDLDEVGCHTDLAGHARVPFTAEAGQTYLFQVTQPAGGGGVVAFNLELLGLVTEVVPHGSLTPRAVMTHQGPRLSGWMGPFAIDVSADGQVVAFSSVQDDLVDDDTNAAEDLFVRDVRTGAVERVSVATDGTEQQPPLLRPHALIDDLPGLVLGAFDLSGDGQVVGFWSEADNLVPGDTNDWPDLFVHDRRTGVTERVSVWSDGRQGLPTIDPHEEAIFHRGGHLFFQSVSLSHDGRYVAFSTLLRLHADDQPRPPTSHDLSGCLDRCGWEDDVYLHDRLTGETTLVGRASDGRAARDETWRASISGNGRYVSFVSQDDSLTPGDDNLVEDVYVRDLVTGHTERVSVSSAGEAANANSSRSALSYDGRYVVFSSYASNLVPGDTNEFPDIFVHDRVTGETERVTVSTTGEQAEGGRPLCDILRVSISYDGRYVVFSSPSNNLVPDDNRVDLATGSQAMSDVFLRDRVRGTTTMVSITPSGHQPNAPSMGAAISGDGRSIAFVSWADLEDDTATPAPPLNLTEVDLRRGAYVYRPPTVVR